MRHLLGIGAAIVFAACSTPQGAAAPTPSPTLPVPTPTQTAPPPSPTPAPALNPAHIWVSVEGRSSALASISPSLDVTTVTLPLNSGQQASDIHRAASPDALFYLVWEGDGTQRGVAAWDLHEGDARFITLTPEDARITHLLPSTKGDRLALVITERESWRLITVGLGAGDTQTVTTSEALSSTLPPTPFAWPADGPILLNTLSAEGASQGIYAINPQDGSNRLLVEPEPDEVLIAPRLSPDATRIAYLSYQPDLLPQEARETTPTNVLRIVDLRLGSITTMTPERGHAIYGARWAGEGLLLDLVRIPLGEAPTADRQSWAYVDVGQALPWGQSPGGPERANLFDYRPYGDGVVFTTLPTDDVWQVYIQSDLTQPPTAVRLNTLAKQEGAPRILHTP